MNKTAQKPSAAFIRRILASATVMMIATPGAFANPQGGVVAAGSAAISSAGSTLTVQQQSDRAVVNWQSFNVDTGESVRFNQPGSSSVTLNRVTNGDPSQILGNISANGNVVIVNPNGVVFGRDSHVDVNGLIATTADIDNTKFMNGGMTFDKPGNPDAAVINNGAITAQQAGLVGLVAPNVVNNGTITARMGRVQLASGDTATVDLYGDRLMEVAVGDDVKKQLVSNTGTIDAGGGTIAMTAAAGRNVVDSLVEVKGELKTPTVSQKDGAIYIAGDDGAPDTGDIAGHNVIVQAKLDASGTGVNDTGGSVRILGNHVTVKSGSVIDASGTAGGGTIRVGGGRQGGEGLTGSAVTTVESGAVIKADAVAKGTGGSVAVWSDGHTSYDGAISAKNTGTGNGGDVEVSGKRTLDFTGSVDLAAYDGLVGTLLLDPENITIQAGAGTPALTCSGGACTAVADSSVLTVAALQAALASGNVTVSTGSTGSQTGNIVVADNLTWSTGNLLTLAAAGNITINSGVTVSNTYTGSTFGAGTVPVVLALRADAGSVNGQATAAGSSYGVVNSGTIDFSGSTGAASIFYDWNGTYTAGTQTAKTGGWTNPSPNSGLASQFTAYKLVDSVADLVAVGGALGGNYSLGKTLNGGGAAFNGNVPLGTLTGILDGQYCGLGGGTNCGINNLTLNMANTTKMGLFNQNDGTIRNLALNVAVTGTNNTLTTKTDIASLVALNNGTVANVASTGSVTFTYSGANTSQLNSFNIGGLVATNMGTIIGSSTATGSVIVNNNQAGTADVYYHVGGLAGQYGTIKNSTSSMAVTFNQQATSGTGGGVGLGGLVGYSAPGTLSGDTSSGDITYNQGSNLAMGLTIGGLDGSMGAGSTVASSSSSSHVILQYSGGFSPTLTSIFVGGLIGRIDNASIAGSSSSGTVESTISSSVQDMGGLIGIVQVGTPSIDSSSSSSIVKLTGAGSVLMGGLVGSITAGTISNSYATGNTTVTGTAGGDIGGLLGSIGGTVAVTNSYAQGGVVTNTATNGASPGTIRMGGFIGGTGGTATISGSYTTENVLYDNQNTSATAMNAYVGGFVGDNSSTAATSITQSYATGSVTAQYSNGGTQPINGLVGGFIGENGFHSANVVRQSYATGAVSSALTGAGNEGGFVGLNASTDVNSIVDSYSLGNVSYTGGNSSQRTGGFTGSNSGGGSGTGAISNSYSTGYVTANAGGVGGFYANNNGVVGASNYWTTDTSNIAAGGTASGVTTTTLQSALPSGWSNWSIVAGVSYPYLSWQVPSGTPQIISGTVYGAGNPVAGGSSPLAGGTVASLIGGGAAPASFLTGGNASIGYNGYYYYLLAPNTLNGTPFLSYLTGATKADYFNAALSSSLSGRNLYANTVVLRASAGITNFSGLTTNLATAMGSNSGSNFLYTLSGNALTGASNDLLYLQTSAASFDIDAAFASSGASGGITLNNTNTVTQSAALTTSNLQLLGTGGIYTLNNSSNAIGTLAAAVGTGTVTLNDGANALAIGSVNGTNGVTAGTLNLSGTGGGSESQSVNATNLSVQGTGVWNLASVVNNVGTLAASMTGTTATGQLKLYNSTHDLSIGSVNGIDGVTAPAVYLSTASGANTISQAQAINASTLALINATINLNNAGNNISTVAASIGTGTMTLNNGANALSIGSSFGTNGITAGTLNLTDTGTVTQSQAIAATNLQLLGSGGTYTLSTANTVGTLAANVGTGAVTFNNGANALSIGTVGGTAGVTAGTLALTDTGTTTQANAITATSLSLAGNGGIFTLNNASNNAGTLAASVGSGTITYNNGANALSVGTVGSVNGITAGTLNLTDTGAVTQSQAIATTNLQLTGSGATYTLSGANNVGTLAASVGTGTVTFNNGANNLSIGTIGPTSGVTAATLALTDTGTTTQASAITTASLSLAGSGGIFTLNNASNNTGTLAASVGTGTVAYNNGANALAIGTVGGISGIAADTLKLTDSNAVTQSQAVVATNAGLFGGGSYTLNNTGNAIGTLAGTTGALSLTDSTALTLGTVGGITGATATGAVTIAADGMTLGGGLSAAGQSVILKPFTAANAVTVGASGSGLVLSAADINANVTAGSLTLGSASGGGLTTSAAINPAHVGGVLTLLASGDITLGNTVTNAGGLTVTSGAGKVNVDTTGLTTTGTAINLTGATGIAVGNDTTIASGNGAVSLNGAVTAGGNITVNAGTGTFTASSTIAAGAHDLSINADDIALNGSVGGTGTLTLAPASTNKIVRVNYGAGDFNLDGTELGYLANGWGQINIGNAGDSAVMEIGAATFNDPVSFLGSGKRNVRDALAGLGDASFTFLGGTGWTDIYGSVTTAGGKVDMSALNHVYFAAGAAESINSGGGNILLPETQVETDGAHAAGINSGNGNITVGGALFSNGARAVTFNAGTGTLAFAGTIDGGITLNAMAATETFAGAMGWVTPLAAVNLTATNSLTLPSIVAGSILVQATGAASDITIGSGTALDATGTGDALVLSAHRNFINNEGSGALTAGNGRWLVYSTNPTDTIGEETLANGFNRYGCTYAGGCVAGVGIPASGNGLIYSYQPVLAVTPNALAAISYGDAAPSTANYGYALSGYRSGEFADTVTGALNGTTDYTLGSNAGSYYLHYASGSLTSALGYTFSYGDLASALTVNKKNITASFASTLTKTYGDNNPALNYSNFIFSTLVPGDSASLFSSITPNYGATTTDTNVGGGYAVTAAIADTTNYHITNTPATTMAITARPLTVTTADKTKVAGAPDPVFTGSNTLIASDAALISWLYAPQAYAGNAGSYTIGATATDPSNRLANYARTNNYGTFIVNPGNYVPPPPVPPVLPPAALVVTIPDTVIQISQSSAIVVGSPIDSGHTAPAASPTSSPAAPWSSPTSSTPASSNNPVKSMHGLLEIDPSLSQQIGLEDISNL